MENIEIILSLIVTIAGFITSTVTFVIKYLQSLSANKNAEQQIKITNLLPEIMNEAEQTIGLTGEQKKSYVLEKLRSYAEKNGINYNEQLVSRMIEELIALTKTINI